MANPPHRIPPRKRMEQAKVDLQSHLSLAKKRARAQNQTANPENVRAIQGILGSAKKHLKIINEERKKHYQKPLTIAEYIEIIRESE